MDKRWRFDQGKLRKAVMVVFLLVLHQSMSLCWSLNSEGIALLRIREGVVNDPFGALSDWKYDNQGQVDPCSWFGVECSDGKVVILNLKDLCLGGTLAPEIGKLTHIKSIILRNNSFGGEIPKEIQELEGLEVLDLGYNNFTGSLPSDLGNNLSLTTLLLDNNKFIGEISPELHELKMLSEYLVDEKQLTSVATRACCGFNSINWNAGRFRDIVYQRRLLADTTNPPLAIRNQGQERHSLSPSPSPSSPSPASSISPFRPSPSRNSSSPSPSPFSQPPTPSPSASGPSIFLIPSPSPAVVPVSPAPTPVSPVPENPPVILAPPPPELVAVPSPVLSPSQARPNKHTFQILVGIIGGSVFLMIAAVGFAFFRNNKVVTVKPWSTGLSGQLQKAFVTGVPKLNRSELEAACEDFSNIISFVSDITVYKGTLSSGVEIAVTSSEVTTLQNWPKNKEARFRTKIEILSRVNHKNFVNLIGYCEEEKPFTRMMVFEYAPNGTLFEHLHIKEAEHLDWKMRLRIAMGIAYCLEHMHQLNPPIVHTNLQSSSIYLTEDYAAKISDFTFWNEVTAVKMGATDVELLETPSADSESNVYSFGVILFEMVTGRIPYCVDGGPFADWATEFLNGDRPVTEMVDPTLTSYKEDELNDLFKVIKQCIHLDPKQRPTMMEITIRLKKITGLEPDGAVPKLSPLWWAELEIMSTEAN